MNELQEKVIAEKFPIGTKVKYYPIKAINRFKETTIKSEPWEVGGSIVLKVEGVRGGVDIEHLEVL